jgi:hypothetical protein
MTSEINPFQGLNDKKRQTEKRKKNKKKSKKR